MNIGERHPDRADFLCAAHGVGNHRHLGFGEGITFDDHSARQFLESFLRLGHQRCGTGEAQLDRCEIHLALPRPRMVHDSVQQRGNCADESRLYVGYLAQHVAEITRVWYQRDWVVID